MAAGTRTVNPGTSGHCQYRLFSHETAREMVRYLERGGESARHYNGPSRTAAEQASNRRIRNRILKRVMMGKGFRDNLTDEAERRGLLGPMGRAKDAAEKEAPALPDTYENARQLAKEGEFGASVRMLWKLHCNGKGAEAAGKAKEGKDWFSIATLRFFTAAKADSYEAYLLAFTMMDSLNGTQGTAFEREVVRRKGEFGEWDRGMDDGTRPKLNLARNDSADRNMMLHARERGMAALKKAAAAAEMIEDDIARAEALREVALACKESGLPGFQHVAADLFEKALRALPKERSSGKEACECALVMSAIAGAMAKAGFMDEARRTFRAAAGLPGTRIVRGRDGTVEDAMALIEIGLEQGRAGLQYKREITATFTGVSDVAEFGLPQETDRIAILAKWGAALKKLGMDNEAAEKFDKAADRAFHLLAGSVGGNGHYAASEALVGLVSEMARAGMLAEASEYLERGIEGYGAGEFHGMCANAHVAIGAAELLQGNRLLAEALGSAPAVVLEVGGRAQKSWDRAKADFAAAMRHMDEFGSAPHAARTLAETGIAYGAAGHAIEARARLEGARALLARMAEPEKSVAGQRQVSAYFEAGLLKGLDGREAGRALGRLREAATGIGRPLYSMRALVDVAAAQRAAGLGNEANRTLAAARWRIVGPYYGAESELDERRALLSRAFAEHGNFSDARTWALPITDRRLRSRAFARIVSEKAWRAARAGTEAPAEGSERKAEAGEGAGTEGRKWILHGGGYVPYARNQRVRDYNC